MSLGHGQSFLEMVGTVVWHRSVLGPLDVTEKIKGNKCGKRQLLSVIDWKCLEKGKRSQSTSLVVYLDQREEGCS